MSAVNLSPSPLFFFLPSRPQGQFSLAFLSIVRLPLPPSWPSATGSCLLQNPAGVPVASAALHTAKRSLGAIVHPRTSFSQHFCGLVCVSSIQRLSDPADLTTLVWDGTRLLCNWMLRLGVELQMCQRGFLFFFFLWGLLASPNGRGKTTTGISTHAGVT